MTSASRIILGAAMAIMAGAPAIQAQPESAKLTGKVIGTEQSVDYSNSWWPSTTVNTKANAFDGDLKTFFASYDRSFTWAGLELDEEKVITRVGWSPRDDSNGPARVELGVFQGANKEDFSDAVPLYMIKEKGTIGKMSYADVDVSRGFKYVRYVGPHEARCNIAEIEFYGYSGKGDDSHFYQATNLPLVVVNTPNMEWFRDNDKKYEMNGSQIYVVKDGKFDIDAPGQIRGRGNGSWTFPKKPFRIKFDKKQKVLGGPAKAKKWTMINNYGDKTLMRNMLAFDISRKMAMAFTPQCHPVDLIFNGEYQGTYQLCDQVEVKEGRVEITEMEPTDTEGLALTGGYLIEIDAYATDEPAGEWFYSQGGHSIPVTIKSPDPGVTQQYNYIRDYFTKMEKALYTTNYTDPTTGYRKYLDLESFLRHFLLGEMVGNTDTYWSVYMTLERGTDKFITGPGWDFDLGFENDGRTYPINNRNDFVCFSGSFANGMKDFADRIIHKDAGAKKLMSQIWSYARYFSGLNYEELNAKVTEYANLLNESQKLNFKRWNIMNSIVHQNPKIYGSYEAEVQNVRDYIKARITKMDALVGLADRDAIDEITTDTTSGYVTVAAGELRIVCEGQWNVVNLQGITVARGNGDANVALTPGLYLVTMGGKTTKVLL